MAQLFRRRPHTLGLGIGEHKPVVVKTGVWRNSWVISLPFGLRLSRIPAGVIMTTKDEWERRDRLLNAVMPVYFEASRACAQGFEPMVMMHVVEQAKREVERIG